MGQLAGFAQGIGVGVRAGASVDPDQFYFGAHVETPAIVDRVHLRPNLEIGVGDDATLVGREHRGGLQVPAAPEPVDRLRRRRAGHQLLQLRQRRDSDTRGGLNFVGGLEHERGLFFEVKVGAWDSADLKFGVGYNFGR